MAGQSKPLPLRSLGALGVVFGDIGTSPLYALGQVGTDDPGFAGHPADILGVLSLLLWSVIFVVCVKYTLVVMRADHDGEGGTLALLGLIEQQRPPHPVARPSWLVLLVLAGSALLVGDGMITPSISVLSAVEGLNVATDIFKPYVLPIAVVILALLFLIQSRGTARVGTLFGPAMLLWFGFIGAMGMIWILRRPDVLAAANPLLGLHWIATHGLHGYLLLGAIVLAFSGAEALFADMGHFGRVPIIWAWYVVVLPALMLNYLGEGALLLTDPKAAAQPFFRMVPQGWLYPAVGIATLATVIASQAVISGVFSLASQAINMGLAPRWRVKHTAADTRGQVYVSMINRMLCTGCLAVVLGFRSSAALGAAYGLAVIGTMTVTSIVFYLVMRRVWTWGVLAAASVALPFLLFDLAFLGANLAKIPQGAWVPLAIGLAIFLLLALWTDGRARYREALESWSMDAADCRREAEGWEERRQGSVVFLTTTTDRVPLVGKHRWLRENCRYERILLLHVVTCRTPYVEEADRVTVWQAEHGFYCAEARFGFMERPVAGRVMQDALPFDYATTAFILPQPVAMGGKGFLSRLSHTVFLWLARTGESAVEWFEIPPEQAISVGLALDY